MPFVLHAWLRSGNTGAGRGVAEFLKEALALLPKGMGIRWVRADSVFFDQKLLRFLEEMGLSYIVVARLGRQMKRKLCGIDDWVVGGAILGRKGRDAVLRFLESWGGLKKHIPLTKEALKALKPIAPLLLKPPRERELLDDLACGARAI